MNHIFEYLEKDVINYKGGNVSKFIRDTFPNFEYISNLKLCGNSEITKTKTRIVLILNLDTNEVVNIFHVINGFGCCDMDNYNDYFYYFPINIINKIYIYKITSNEIWYSDVYLNYMTILSHSDFESNTSCKIDDVITYYNIKIIEKSL